MRFYSLLVLMVFIQFFSHAQVVIGDANALPGTMLQLESNEEALLIPKVNLTAITDATTVTPSATEGLLVYNLAETGSLSTDVDEGFYYWDGLIWKRLYTQGFSEHFEQTTPVIANNQNTNYTLTNLNRTVNLPYNGTYQVYVTAYYASGDRTGSFDGSGYSEVFLEVDGTKEISRFVTSSSKLTNGGSFNKLAQQVTLIYNIDLLKGNHTFRVRGNEWVKINSDDGVWGIDTANYSGNDRDVNNTQKATMTITLLRQF